MNRDLLKRVGMLTAATAACTAGVFGALALNGLRYMRPTADNWWLLPTDASLPNVVLDQISRFCASYPVTV